MFLTPEDMAHLTGYQRPSAQARWLMRNIPMRISELAVFCRVNRVLTPRRIERQSAGRRLFLLDSGER